ncbi:MAG: hypothetical protein GF329_10635 [Candidatus Lokiarchaeota archaeon]|nr:hypothetical protein [Candidatus Lokiarchaeota archaeon]
MGSFKIYAISDLHGNKRKFEFASTIIKQEKPDLILVCGDISHSSRAKRLEHMISFLNFDQIFFILGNMDGQEVETEVSNAKNIHLKKEKFMGYIFYGIGGPTHVLANAIDEAEATLKNSNRDKLVIICHVPPRNHNDRVYSGKNVGSKPLKNLIGKIQPKVVLCGHIHEDRGVSKLKNTPIINVGPEGFIIEINDDNNLTYRAIED